MKCVIIKIRIRRGFYKIASIGLKIEVDSDDFTELEPNHSQTQNENLIHVIELTQILK